MNPQSFEVWCLFVITVVGTGIISFGIIQRMFPQIGFVDDKGILRGNIIFFIIGGIFLLIPLLYLLGINPIER